MAGDPRSTILRRRAAFVASALAAIHCGGPQKEPPNVPLAPTGETPPTATTTTPPEVPPDPPKLAKPNFDMPQDIGPVAKSNFEYLFRQTKSTLDTLAEAESKLPPACDLKDPACEKAFRDVAELMWRADPSRGRMASCPPGTSNDAKLYYEREREHRAYVDKRREGVLAKIKTLTGGNEKRWNELVADVDHAHPMPCLSIMCRDW